MLSGLKTGANLRYCNLTGKAFPEEHHTNLWRGLNWISIVLKAMVIRG
jgi:hypothetical protein